MTQIRQHSVFLFALLFIHVEATFVIAGTLRTVALSDSIAPGTVGANFASNFSTPVLNNAGRVAFRGFLTGPSTTTTNNLGIWSEGGGNGLQLIAQRGNLAPGTSGALFSSLGNPVLNNSGQTAFFSSLTGTGVTASNNNGIWSEGEGGGLQLVSLKGNPAAGTSGNVFGSFNTPVLNDAGQTAFRGFLTGAGVTSSNDGGIWSEGGDNGLQLVAREGELAPGTSGAEFSSGFGNVVLNDLGETAFRGFLNGSVGIWSEGGGNGLQLVALKGNPAQGTSGADFLGFGSGPAINNAGQTAFSGLLIGIGVDASNNRGIWSGDGGNGLQLVARTDDAAPGTSGAKFLALPSDPLLNSEGHAAFLGTITGSAVTSSNDKGIWSEGGGGGLQLVAREGDAAPGAPGTNFNVLQFDVALNGLGQTAFRGTLIGTGVNSSNDAGIWAEDMAGNLTLIAREGDLLDVDDGPGTDMRTIAQVLFAVRTGNEDGRYSGFNDRGQLAFFASFTDGSSGIFVSNLVAIPEPTSAALMIVPIVYLGLRRQSKHYS